jgi:hypothetical protein
MLLNVLTLLSVMIAITLASPFRPGMMCQQDEEWCDKLHKCIHFANYEWECFGGVLSASSTSSMASKDPLTVDRQTKSDAAWGALGKHCGRGLKWCASLSRCVFLENYSSDCLLRASLGSEVRLLILLLTQHRSEGLNTMRLNQSQIKDAWWKCTPLKEIWCRSRNQCMSLSDFTRHCWNKPRG